MTPAEREKRLDAAEKASREDRAPRLSCDPLLARAPGETGGEGPLVITRANRLLLRAR